MNLKRVLMDLGNELVQGHCFTPAATCRCNYDLVAMTMASTTGPLALVAAWLNQVPEARAILASKGIAWPVVGEPEAPDPVSDEVLELRGQVAELEAEIRRRDELKLVSVEYGPQTGGSINMGWEGEPAKVFLATLVRFFYDNGGENFLTFTVDSRAIDGQPAHRLEVTIRNRDGSKTPSERIAELERQLDVERQERKKLAVGQDQAVKLAEILDRLDREGLLVSVDNVVDVLPPEVHGGQWRASIMELDCDSEKSVHGEATSPLEAILMADRAVDAAGMKRRRDGA